VPVLVLAAFGIVGIIQAVVSGRAVVWGIAAGVSLLICGYLIVKSLVPIKRYRDATKD
jgi:hypothetical protein